MKLYVVSDTPCGTGDIKGNYYLITADGECLGGHYCSNKSYAIGDLYLHRPERIDLYEQRFGNVEVMYFGEDDMTIGELQTLNRQWAEANGIGNCTSRFPIVDYAELCLLN